MSREVPPGDRQVRRRRDAPSLPPVLTTRRLGRLLGMQSERATRSFISREGVPHVRAGKRILVLLDSLLDWLKEREVRRDPDDGVAAFVRRLGRGQTNVADVVRRTAGAAQPRGRGGDQE